MDDDVIEVDGHIGISLQPADAIKLAAKMLAIAREGRPVWLDLQNLGSIEVSEVVPETEAVP